MEKKIRRRKFLETVGKVAVVTAVTGTLEGCGSPAPPSKDKILADVRDKDDTYLRYNINVTSYEIIERETSKTDMIDNVCFQVIGETNNFSYEATYKITYVLREKTWMIGSFECQESQFVPLNFPTETDAQKVIEQEDRQCVSLGQTDGDGWKNFIYTFQCIDRIYTSFGLVSQIDVELKFTPSTDTIWKANIKNSEIIGYQFYLAGDWYRKDEDHDCYINVGESPVQMFEDTPILTVNSYKIWYRSREWYRSESVEKRYESNEAVDLTGGIGTPFDIGYSLERKKFDELTWYFKVEGESGVVQVAYNSGQDDFVLSGYSRA